MLRAVSQVGYASTLSILYDNLVLKKARTGTTCQVLFSSRHRLSLFHCVELFLVLCQVRL